MPRHWLSDEQWSLVSELLAPPAATGRPRSDGRQVVDAIFWIVRTGAPWRDLPERFGPWQTVYHCFNAWSRDGTWDRILEALQIRLDAEGRIGWELWCVDGSHIRASRAAAGGGKKGALRTPRPRIGPLARRIFGTKLHLVTDGAGLPIAIEVTAGQRRGSTQFETLMDAVCI